MHRAVKVKKKTPEGQTREKKGREQGWQRGFIIRITKAMGKKKRGEAGKRKEKEQRRQPRYEDNQGDDEKKE